MLFPLQYCQFDKHPALALHHEYSFLFFFRWGISVIFSYNDSKTRNSIH